MLVDIEQLAAALHEAYLSRPQLPPSSFWDYDDIAYHLRASKSTVTRWVSLPDFRKIQQNRCTIPSEFRQRFRQRFRQEGGYGVHPKKRASLERRGRRRYRKKTQIVLDVMLYCATIQTSKHNNYRRAK